MIIIEIRRRHFIPMKRMDLNYRFKLFSGFFNSPHRDELTLETFRPKKNSKKEIIPRDGP